MKTGYECTGTFHGIDGMGTCDNECQWWSKKNGCPFAKGHKNWDGNEHYTKQREFQDERCEGESGK